MENKPLTFEEFSPVGKAKWVEKAKVDLKGADFERKLVWKTDNGQAVQPFYTREDLPETEYSEQFLKCLPSQGSREWNNLYKIKGQDMASRRAQIEAGQKIGATGFVIDMQGVEALDWEHLFEGVNLEETSISFLNSVRPDKIVIEMLEYAKEKGHDPSKIKGFIDADAFRVFARTGELSQEVMEQVAHTITRLGDKCPEFSAFTISCSEFTDAGANHIQELAFTLNKLTDYIERFEELGLDKAKILGKLNIVLAVGTDYFHEIAKFRAIRVLVDGVLKTYGEEFANCKVQIIGASSLWTKTLYDPHVNMLRNTTEAMSAVLGGCDTLILDTFNEAFAEPDAFGKRISYNVSRLLKEESYFDKVVDPAAGSYYLEHLTDTLVSEATTLFLDIEEKGGFVKAFESGIIQEQITAIREKKQKNIASRRTTVVGTNRYPNTGEHIDPINLPESDAQKLTEQRAATVFESLRLHTERFVADGNDRPKVLLALYGHPAMRKARSTFTGDFFGTAGFDIEERYFDSAQQAAEQSANSDASIVVICSSDQDYEAEGLNYVNTFKGISKEKLLVLAGYPKELEESLTEAGLDMFVHVRTNAVEALTSFQQKLGIIKA
ncbi:methylmalonyl-CoA mutase [Fulvitalea axinellae]|uniref:Methylmalonyl-CoA mutase n=1 Tax=Fulvitalea axinellae TaxID=1182444 RepID=A0AAU9CAQ8_9BACT|nr:methylmalonyl-CoA mutase [Fulvitalea axinellae]